jgi:uncharacterized protein YqcC (DUF446 family)
MPRRYQEVEILLKKLIESLHKANLWSDTAPSKQAMASKVPFACDVMPLENWLQFIFIPKMCELIQMGKPLPPVIQLLPIAQMSFNGLKEKQLLLKDIEKIDEWFNE